MPTQSTITSLERGADLATQQQIIAIKYDPVVVAGAVGAVKEVTDLSIFLALKVPT